MAIRSPCSTRTSTASSWSRLPSFTWPICTAVRLPCIGPRRDNECVQDRPDRLTETHSTFLEHGRMPLYPGMYGGDTPCSPNGRERSRRAINSLHVVTPSATIDLP